MAIDDDRAAAERVAKVEALLEDVEGLPDPAARETASELVAAVVELYGDGLARVMEAVDDQARAAFARDELLGHLLLLHDLHPVAIEDRVRGALDEVAPYLESHGGGVEIAGISEGVVRLRLEGSCSGCPSSTMTLKLAIEDAIHKAAPDVERIEAEGVTEPAAPPDGLIQLGVAPGAASAGAGNGTGPAGGAATPEGGAWATAGSLQEIPAGGTLVKRVAGEPVLFARIEETFYAYRPACPGCHSSLEGAALERVDLVCPECARRYDAIRAGRCLDEPTLYLDPVPLLVADSGLVKVAVAAPVA
jgi:Fe-S cluster biogenesis protein NfuA